jgi:hypothetical protein
MRGVGNAMLHDILVGHIFWLAIILLPWILLVLVKLRDTVNGVNRKLDLLMKHSGMNVQEVAIREVQPFLREGKKIEAINRYREITGAGLAEAKAAVEKVQEDAGPA